jgi:hypothetical protein
LLGPGREGDEKRQDASGKEQGPEKQGGKAAGRPAVIDEYILFADIIHGVDSLT